MQVPERLALIGGSILLSSLLIFTLKSQASQILPKIEHPINTIYQHAGDAQKASEFDDNFKQAQQKSWKTGNWGTAKFYVDNNENMHVGAGQLSGSFSKVVNDQKIKDISLDGHEQAPQDSSFLFANSNGSSIPLTQINGLSNLDTSQVNNMDDMFDADTSLSNLDLSHFDTSSVTNMGGIFVDDSSLSSLDLSHFDTHNATDMTGIFYEDNIHQLSLGPNIKLHDNGLTGTYQNNGQTLNLDGNAHPGTWVKQ